MSMGDVMVKKVLQKPLSGDDICDFFTLYL